MEAKQSKRAIIQVIGFTAIGVFLIWWTYRKDDPIKLWSCITQLNFIYYLPVLVWTLICHYFRTKRWQLILKAGTNFRVPFFPAYHSIMAGYFVNFPTGKLGEVFRCYALRRMAGIPVERALGSVVMERVIDVCCLLLLMLFSLVIYSERLITLTKEEIITPLKSAMGGGFHLIYLLLASISFAALGVTICYFVWKKMKSVHTLIHGFKNGLLSIFRLKEKGTFLFYTAGIWLMYLLMTYTWFFAMKETAQLGPLAALLVIVLGGIGRSLPVPGHGAGPYHYFATKALMLVGLAAASAGILPIVIHAGQTLFYLIAGAISLIVFSMSKAVPLQEKG